jgi:hypothetical protein
MAAFFFVIARDLDSQASSESRMELTWSVVPIIGIIGLIAGGVTAVFGFRKKEKPMLIETVDGTLKQDWTRTGKIDFFVRELGSASPQLLILRVEDRRIMETIMGQDVVELRWRLASLEEAKEVVVSWNASKKSAEDGDMR